MNDEPPSPASAPQAPRPSSQQENSGHQQSSEAQNSRRKQNREAFNRKRGDLLDDVLRSFDILIYAELSAIYYMDCYFFRFFLRAVVQLIFLTPKSGFLPEPPANRPYIGAILGGNILCFVLHALGNAPLAGEATRGYLHGGLAMDFIGQKGPSSKIHLLVLDILVLVLQIAHLSAHLLRQRLKDNVMPTVVAAVSNGQTVNDEERGVRHSLESQQRDDIEMQTLNSSGAAAGSADINPNVEGLSSSQDALLTETIPPAHTDAHVVDAFNSGQIVLADLSLLQTVQEQLVAYQKSGSQEALRAEYRQNLSERLARLRLRFGGAGRTP